MRQVKNVMGFDCEFLEPPPENLQTRCPVCLQIIREPYQVPCCGKKYCQSCIQTIKIKNKSCPTCNTEGFSNFPDTGHKQSLYGLKVRCSHQKDGCEWTGELRQLDEHLNTDPLPEKQLDGCRLTIINCDFHHVGCAVKLPRQDMPEHVRTSVHRHMSLMVTGHMTLASAHSILENDHANLEKDHKKLVEEHKSLSSNSVQLCKYEELKDNCAEIKTDNQQLRNKIEALEVLIRSPLADPPRTETIHIVPSDGIVMDNFEQHKRDNDEWYSPPLYTHPQGYKICLCVDANGWGTGEGTHVTVGVHFMRGEFDNSLKWPFRGSILIQLVDQNGQPNDIRTIVYNDSMPIEECSRVMYGERATGGWGFGKFLAHNMLKKPLFNDNQLIFMISGEVRV